MSSVVPNYSISFLDVSKEFCYLAGKFVARLDTRYSLHSNKCVLAKNDEVTVTIYVHTALHVWKIFQRESRYLPKLNSSNFFS